MNDVTKFKLEVIKHTFASECRALEDAEYQELVLELHEYILHLYGVTRVAGREAARPGAVQAEDVRPGPDLGWTAFDDAVINAQSIPTIHYFDHEGNAICGAGGKPVRMWGQIHCPKCRECEEIRGDDLQKFRPNPNYIPSTVYAPHPHAH